MEGRADVECATLLIERPADGVIRIRINRPKTMNAITNRMELELDHAFMTAEKDDSVRAVILTGSGGEAFSTGYAMEDPEAATPPSVDPAGTGPYLLWWHDREELHRKCLLRVWDLAKPVIAAVDGRAISGGSECAMVCDVTIASETAGIGEPQIRHCSSPPVLIMPWIVGWKQAKRLLLTGEVIDAQEALRIRLFTAVVPPAELEEQAVRLAERLAHVPPMTMKWNKMAINRTVEQMGLKAALEINTPLTIFSHAAFSKDEGNRVRLEEALKSDGVPAYLALRDSWFDNQARGLKV
jgi:enoyl-CoA hydratase